MCGILFKIQKKKITSKTKNQVNMKEKKQKLNWIDDEYQGVRDIIMIQNVIRWGAYTIWKYSFIWIKYTETVDIL